MRKSLSLWPLVATIFFCVSGGPFGLEPVMQHGAGIGLLLIAVTPVVWALPAALMTAELASMMPVEGGYYVWVRRALGPFAGFLCAWWTWVQSWVDVAIYPTLFAAYVDRLIVELGGQSAIDSNPMLKWLVGLAVIVPFTWLNIRGARAVGNVGLRFGLIMLFPFLVMAVLGIGQALTRPLPNFVTPGESPTAAFGAGLFVVMWNYFGWDTMSTVAGEVEEPRRTFPRAIAIALPIIVGWYLVSAWIGIGSYRDISKWQEGAWTDIAGAIGGHGLAIAMTLAGIVSAGGLFSATLLASSRIPFVLAEDGYLPEWLTRLHPRHGTPTAAILVSAVFYTLFSYASFERLAVADVVLYSAGLLLELVALAVLRHREPATERPFRIPGGWAVLGLVIALPAAIVAFAIVSQFRDPEEGGRQFLTISGIGLATGLMAWPLARRHAMRSH